LPLKKDPRGQKNTIILKVQLIVDLSLTERATRLPLEKYPSVFSPGLQQEEKRAKRIWKARKLFQYQDYEKTRMFLGITDVISAALLNKYS
jgi:hypothetical protein